MTLARTAKVNHGPVLTLLPESSFAAWLWLFQTHIRWSSICGSELHSLYRLAHSLIHVLPRLTRFCREGEFVIRTIYIAYRLYPVYSIKTCFSVLYFGDGFYYKANIAYFKASSLPEDPTLRSEMKEVMYATFTLFEGLNARMKARIKRPTFPLLNIESRDMDQTCPTHLEKHRVHPHDSRVGYGSNQRHGGKAGLWASVGGSFLPIFASHGNLGHEEAQKV